MITVVVGKEIEKLKGEFESVINGMNMVGEIPYNVYSELFDVGTDCIQKAYELGKSELEKENAELKEKNEGYCRSRDRLISIGFPTFKDCKEYAEHLTKALEKGEQLEKENAELKKDKKELCHSISEGGKACAYLNKQLNKAKNIIKKFLLWENDWRNKTESKYELLKEAEQFIKDSEVEK